MFLITPQTQPCPVSCVATCIAMIAGKPATVIRDQFHDCYRDGNLSIGDMLRELGIPFTDFRSAERNSVNERGIWLLGVPSLNIRGGGHQIVLEWDDEDDLMVFDPNLGHDDRSYYVAPGTGDGDKAFDLGGGYNVDCWITRADLIAWRERNV